MIQEFEYSACDGGVEVTLKSGSRAGRTAFFPDVSLEQMNEGSALYLHKGALIQRAFSFLSSSQREFLMTGIYAEEWDEIFGEWE